MYEMEQRLDTKQRILNAAERVFDRAGYRDATLRASAGHMSIRDQPWV